MSKRQFNLRFQFRLVSLLWLTLVAAAFFFGRNWETLSRLAQPTSAKKAGRPMFGVGVNSDAGLLGQIETDEANFSLDLVDRGGA